MQRKKLRVISIIVEYLYDVITLPPCYMSSLLLSVTKGKNRHQFNTKFKHSIEETRTKSCALSSFITDYQNNNWEGGGGVC